MSNTSKSTVLLEYQRKTSREGWLMLAQIAMVGVGLGFIIFCIDDAMIMKTILVLLLLSMLTVGALYAADNFRNPGTFVCRLTDEQIIQHSPARACGENFQIKLSEITLLEIRHSAGEPSCDFFHIHTSDSRYEISINYGNPYQKFGKKLQKLLPNIQTIETKK